ncbi:MAG: hypothetical protein IPK80_05015 [Nannocystis sp.]|nr:hypothetical protein [Nannocystis sp.]
MGRSDGERGAWGWRLAALALAAGHVGALGVFVEPALWWAGEPLPGVDYQTHAAQAWRVVEGLEGWGKSWVYDPQILAGGIEGAIFDADNKGWELWTFVGARLGLSRAGAFNSFALVAHLAGPWVIYGSARLWGLTRGAALAAAWMAAGLWWLDSWLHWCWWVGMVAYATAAYLATLPLALFFRFMEDRRGWQAIGAGASLGLCHLIHPYSFFILGPPMLWLYLRSWRRLRWQEHAAVGGIVAATIAVNWYWLAVALSFWRYVLDSGYYGQSTLTTLAADLAEWVIDPATTGQIGARTSARWVTMAAAIAGMIAWRRAADRRWAPLAIGLGWLAGLAYLGGYWRVSGQIQPYRHVAPMVMLATIPAAAWLSTIVSSEGPRPWQGWPRSARVALGLLAIPAGQQLVATGGYYVATLLPAQTPLPLRQGSLVRANGHLWTPDYRLTALDPETRALVAWVRAREGEERRFWVELGHLGEMLAWSTKAGILGGFVLRNEAHAAANLLRRFPKGPAPPGLLVRFLEDYAVGWIIVTPDAPWLAQEPRLRRGPVFGGHVVYEVLAPTGLVAAGGGAARGRINEITVAGADPGADLLLRFHWLETLVCRPECAVERWTIEGDPVDFIKIPAPHPAELTIVNSYEVQR